MPDRAADLPTVAVQVTCVLLRWQESVPTIRTSSCCLQKKIRCWGALKVTSAKHDKHQGVHVRGDYRLMLVARSASSHGCHECCPFLRLLVKISVRFCRVEYSSLIIKIMIIIAIMIMVWYPPFLEDH